MEVKFIWYTAVNDRVLEFNAAEHLTALWLTDAVVGEPIFIYLGEL